MGQSSASTASAAGLDVGCVEGAGILLQQMIAAKSFELIATAEHWHQQFKMTFG